MSGPFDHFGTDAIHAGQEPEQWTSMAVVPPISLASTFKQHGPGEHTVSRGVFIAGYVTGGWILNRCNGLHLSISSPN
jgi:cystathionine beta-lyase/cystathionine gamma-synthase